MITILDYEINNLGSVAKAVKHLGFEAQCRRDLQGASKLIVPGVGAFGAAMEKLMPMRDEIRAFAASGKPVLGICLGMQLLFDSSEELGEFEGLGLLPGRVRYLPPAPGLKIPNIGWRSLAYRRSDGLGNGAIDGEQVYFVHSLYADPVDPSDVTATATHGIQFTATIQRGNVWGAQFHPEKSGAVGLRMLSKFLAC